MNNPVQILDQYATSRDAIEALHAQRNAMTAQLRLITTRCAEAEIDLVAANKSADECKNSLREARAIADIELRRGDLMMKERDRFQAEAESACKAQADMRAEIDRLKSERQECAKIAEKNDEDTHSLICEVAIKGGAIADRDAELSRLRAALANAIVPRVVDTRDVEPDSIIMNGESVGYRQWAVVSKRHMAVLLLTPEQHAYWVAKLKEAK